MKGAFAMRWLRFNNALLAKFAIFTLVAGGCGARSPLDELEGLFGDDAGSVVGNPDLDGDVGSDDAGGPGGNPGGGRGGGAGPGAGAGTGTGAGPGAGRGNGA